MSENKQIKDNQMTMTYKFRGKRVDNGEWVFGDLMHQLKECIIGFEVDYDGITVYHKVNVIPESVGMFTGLPDKNGVDIYVGQHVRGWTFDKKVESVGEVVWCRGCFGIKTDEFISQDSDTQRISFMHNNAEFEIIDTPSLLKGE